MDIHLANNGETGDQLRSVKDEIEDHLCVKEEINEVNALILQSDIKNETKLSIEDICIQNKINELSVSILQSVKTNMDDNFKFFNEKQYVDKYFLIYNKKQQSEDVCLRIHTNKIMLLTVAKGNDILLLNKNIQEINFNIHNSDRTRIKVVGKRKLGAKPIHPESIICQVKLEGESFMRNIRAGVTGYIVEINQKVKEDPNLLISDPKGMGFVAILMLKGQRDQHDEILNNMPLLTEEEYIKALKDRNRINIK
ncbi:protein Abitram [Diabrotica undecimpunctata]|uniref:protein Abitram n=1 Tax=Diabrotica undecimpunctata TaxID=50387 RepID=UPI003B6358BF